MRFTSLRPRFESHLLSVERPGHYLGLERNAICKPLSGADVTLRLAFPDTYEIGMSHTRSSSAADRAWRTPSRWRTSSTPS